MKGFLNSTNCCSLVLVQLKAKGRWSAVEKEKLLSFCSSRLIEREKKESEREREKEEKKEKEVYFHTLSTTTLSLSLSLSFLLTSCQIWPKFIRAIYPVSRRSVLDPDSIEYCMHAVNRRSSCMLTLEGCCCCCCCQRKYTFSVLLSYILAACIVTAGKGGRRKKKSWKFANAIKDQLILYVAKVLPDCYYSTLRWSY